MLSLCYFVLHLVSTADIPFGSVAESASISFEIVKGREGGREEPEVHVTDALSVCCESEWLDQKRQRDSSDDATADDDEAIG